jgi:cyclophilin family peptidyl-prolyl cis-trans isomerase
MRRTGNNHSRILSAIVQATLLLSLLPVVAHADINLRMQTDLGALNLLLFNSSTTDPVNTVDNFMDYATSGAYDGMFFHRYAEDPPGTPFILQTGGYTFDPAIGTFFGGGVQAIPVITANLRNEFNRSNTRGTLAMAKVAAQFDVNGNLINGTGPDSADSQWFINLVDNSANLDLQNGGFTVFAAVQGNGMKVFDEMATFGVLATCARFEFFAGICGAFRDMPSTVASSTYDNDSLFNIHSIGFDIDGDGAIDADETDGDGVGGPDSSQSNVASAPLLDNKAEFITVATPSAAYPLQDFEVLGNTYMLTRPAISTCVLNGVNPANGFTSFKVTGLVAGDSLTVTVILPVATLPDSYYFYGSVPGNTNEHWFPAVMYGGPGTTGAEFNGNVVTLHMQDGGWGDADMTADGVVTVAPGGAASSVAPVVLSDSDCDGASDSVENAPANANGDGNGDAVPDSTQSGVASLTDINGRYVTIEAMTSSLNIERVTPSNGQSLFLANSNVAALAGLNLPAGFLEFGISNVVPGGAARIKIKLPSGSAIGKFIVLGPDTGNPAWHWYDFTPDAASGTGAAASLNEVTLDLVDGGRGDADRVVNGVINVNGAPAEVFATTTGGGGGCALTEGDGTSRKAGAWLLLLLLCAVFALQRGCRYSSVVGGSART